MVVTPTRYARSRLRLVLTQHRQESKNQRHAGIKLHPHQPLRNRFRDIFEMHRLPLDEDADGDDGVEGPGRRGGRPRGVEIHGREVRGGAPEEVARAEGGGGCGLDLGGGEELGTGNWEFP